ncbi:uncharacterized protein LOC131659296 [Vicia villosa]|uniref:uncharacterized protein LOC131659296 n=1 Tax=Vicia villosa TaxID=3911 RepID=UPI00273B88CB|nr:uncharacterized protein LOC131659296 [Vicia villosa]
MQWHVKDTHSWIIKSIIKLRETANASEYWAKSIQEQKYKTNAMYAEIHGSNTDMRWKAMFYKNFARPRACFITWLALWERLPTKDRLAKINIITDGVCVFCGEQDTMMHLFFQCRYTAQIWCCILNWLGYRRQAGNWRQESFWLSMETKKKGWRRVLLRMAATEAIYHIWQTRNALCFELIPPTRDLVPQIQSAVALRAQSAKCVKSHIHLGTFEIR